MDKQFDDLIIQYTKLTSDAQTAAIKELRKKSNRILGNRFFSSCRLRLRLRLD